MARDSAGDTVPPIDSTAVCWCLSGAFRVVCPTLPDQGAELVTKCMNAVPLVGNYGLAVAVWNDQASWEQVANFIKRIESDETAASIRESLTRAKSGTP